MIIYDQLAAPVLWSDGDADTTDTGKYRAIPARYVHAVFEIKATLTRDHSVATIKKLSEIESIKAELPTNFFSAVIFFDLAYSSKNSQSVILPLFDGHKLFGFMGGLILRCADSDNTDLSAVIKLTSTESKIPERSIFSNLADLKVEAGKHEGKDGLFIGPSAAIQCFSWNSRNHISKIYTCIIGNGGPAIEISWSYDMFADFAFDIWNKLEGNGEDGTKNSLRFGRVFHKIPVTTEARGPLDAFLIGNFITIDKT